MNSYLYFQVDPIIQEAIIDELMEPLKFCIQYLICKVCCAEYAYVIKPYG